MNLKRILLILVAIFISTILIVSMALVAGIRNGNDTTADTIIIDGLDGEIRVFRDDWGVPNIIGDTLSDVLFGQGFEFARDRSFQLEFYRSLINGELANLFGPSLIETDKVLRTVGLKRAAETMLAKLTPNEIDLMESYVKGINTYYTLHPNNKPFELEVLGAELHPWEVTDTIAMGSIVAFTFAFGGLNDEIEMVKAIQMVGMTKALELFPVDYQPAHDYLSNITEVYAPAMEEQDSGLDLSQDGSIDILDAIKPILGDAHAEILQGYMSNNWVVSGEKTVSGKPFLGNDPHTSLAAQGIWHRVNLMTTDGSILLQGFTFPGTPLLAFGHNKDIAWGVTSGILDAVDLYYINKNSTHYLYNGTEWKEIEQIETQIDVNGGEPVQHTIRSTELGPIINTELGEYVMQWTLSEGYERDNPIRSLIAFNSASSISEMHEALEFMLTGFNWVFADSHSGEIAYQNSGFIPNRNEGFGLIPKNGSAPHAGWTGLVPYEDQLYIVDPEAGYFATANERVDDRELFYISESYAPRHRDDRIEQVLANGTDFEGNHNALTLDDMKSLQTDVKTVVAEDLLDPVLSDLVAYGETSNNELYRTAINLLHDWDHTLTRDSVAGLIFTTYRLFIIESVLRDELGDFLDQYGKGTRVLTDWYRDDRDVEWYDNISTTEVEDSVDMAIISLQRTVDYLSGRFGSDISNWRWGDKHRVILPHQFNSADIEVFNIGGQEGEGSSYTINAISGPSWNGGDIRYTSSFGPYFRHTLEVEPTWSNIWIMVSSGASGNPLSPHYRDAYQNWISNDYHKWESSLEFIMSNYKQTTVIRGEV